MKIEIDLNINIPQLAALLASTAGAGVTTTKPLKDAAAPKAEPKAPAKAAEPKAEEPAAEPQEDADDLIGEGDSVTIDDVKTAAKAYSTGNGRDALAQLIKDHGGTAGVTTIPENNYGAFVAAATSA